MSDDTKICIWCRKTEETASFLKVAHTIPQSLGGLKTCNNVCDACNAYFGNPQSGKISIETALKEALNVSRFHVLHQTDNIKKGNSAGRYKSTFFNIDFKKKNHSIRIKPTYSLRPHFQDHLVRQFKRGIYKILLEEIERQRGDALNDRFNFIREFARYDLDDYPVLHYERSVGIILIANGQFEHPELWIGEEATYAYMIEEYGFIEFELLGHIFALATSKLWKYTFELYRDKSLSLKEKFFYGFRLVKTLDDLDITLNRAFKDK